jgi:hypothetical protein
MIGLNYPAVESVIRWSEIKMTKELFQKLQVCEAALLNLVNEKKSDE